MLEGAPSGVMVGNLNMADERDRGLVRRRATDPENKRRRWDAIDEQFKADAVAALRVAMRWSLEKQDHRAVRGIVQTLAALEAQMCQMTAQGFLGQGSPDRLDALVWALTELMVAPALQHRRPQVRTLG